MLFFLNDMHLAAQQAFRNKLSRKSGLPVTKAGFYFPVLRGGMDFQKIVTRTW